MQKDVQILPRFLRQDFPDSDASTAKKQAKVDVQILLNCLRQNFPESTAFDALTDFDASTVVPRDFCEKVTGPKRHNMTHTRTEAPTTTWTTQREIGRASPTSVLHQNYIWRNHDSERIYDAQARCSCCRHFSMVFIPPGMTPDLRHG